MIFDEPDSTNLTNQPQPHAELDEKGDPLPVTRQYSNDIGEVLAEVTGASAGYRLKGDEIYVRARITSSKLKANPYVPGEFERAWTQPQIPN